MQINWHGKDPVRSFENNHSALSNKGIKMSDGMHYDIQLEKLSTTLWISEKVKLSSPIFSNHLHFFPTSKYPRIWIDLKGYLGGGWLRGPRGDAAGLKYRRQFFGLYYFGTWSKLFPFVGF